VPKRSWEVKHAGILLKLDRGDESFEKTKKLAELICKRIALIRPYVEEVVDFMYQGEARSRLRTEAHVYLYDEKAEIDKLRELWDGRRKTFSKAMKRAEDPLTLYYITLLFADMRVSEPPNRRSLTISLHNKPYGMPVGHIYMKLLRREHRVPDRLS
jgi:hypothetical protein